MVCVCGNAKIRHARMNKIHDGDCRHRTHFNDRPNEVCNCVIFREEKKT